MTDEKTVEFGVYTCSLCAKRYTVNVPHTFDPCAPEQCHECHRAYRLGVEQERERCVRVCKDRAEHHFEATMCADAISRGPKG